MEHLETKTNRRRTELDVFRAILIFMVVVGHSHFKYSDIIYWFHMPLFFITSGYLNKKSDEDFHVFLANKTKRLMVPWLLYACVLVIIPEVIMQKENLVGVFKSICVLLWGGRLSGGVYWYVQTLLLTYLLYYLIRKSKYCRYIIIVCYLLAISESILIYNGPFSVLKNIYLPWNIDVCLLTVVYFYIGQLIRCNESDLNRFKNKSVTILACTITSALIGSVVLLNAKGIFSYNMDMKYVRYADFIFPILIPILFGIIIYTLSCLINKIKYVDVVFQLCGRASMIIMFVHIPIRDWIMVPLFGQSYSIVLYLFLVCCIGLAIYVIAQKNSKAKMLFGV